MLSFWLWGHLTLILLTWRKWWAPNNASKQHMGFNSGFKGLMGVLRQIIPYIVGRLTMMYLVILSDVSPWVFLDFCRASRGELSLYFVGHRTMYFPRYIVVVLWWIFSLFCGNTRGENTGCSVRSLTVNLMRPLVVLSGQYWPFRTDECLLLRIQIHYFFAFKSFMTSLFEALIPLNTLRTGSFKLFKRPLPGVLTILTL